MTLLRRAALCAVVSACAAAPGRTQTFPPPPQRSNPPVPTNSQPTFAPDARSNLGDVGEGIEMLPLPSADVVRLMDAESCNSWTEAGLRSPTVSVERLSVPSRASGEYQKACGAFKVKRLADAEGHSRKALELYEPYAAAWVLLGQILDAEQKPAEAREACATAVKADPNYSPPYLCQAEFATRDKDWQALSGYAKRALELDPANNAYAFYYSAVAALHLKQLAEAELDGQSAAKLDARHHLPQIHILLAKVYEAKGDPNGEAAELREYLKRAPNGAEAVTAKSALAQLEARRAN